MRYEFVTALDTSNVQKLLAVLRYPAFKLGTWNSRGTVDYNTARQYMELLKKFRRPESQTFESLKWSFLTQTIQGKNSKHSL